MKLCINLIHAHLNLEKIGQSF